jgi:uncharacterized protein YjiS (DUF1127 family)
MALVGRRPSPYIEPDTVHRTINRTSMVFQGTGAGEMNWRMNMNTTTYTRDMARAEGMTMGGGLLGRFRTYLSKSRAERQLSQLDDRLLADIGVKRSDINKMVWGR